MQKSFILLFILLLLLIAVAGIIFAGQISCQTNFDGEKEFVIQKGQSVQEIGQNLQTQQIIKSASAFKIYLYLTGRQAKVQAGTYVLESTNIINLVKRLVAGQTDNEVSLKFIEGWTLDEIANYLSQQQIDGCSSCVKNNFINTARVENFKDVYDFLADVPEESLEGFVFPDTYLVFKDAGPIDIISKTLDNFGQKLTSALRTEITAQGKDLYNVIIMASIIEQEVPDEESRKIVSGILWKRLAADMPLQVDSSLKYVIGKQDRAALTYQELEIDSPYNTYKYKGLPPTPICNPGESAIRAAIYPKNSDYWFYLSTPEGETIFSKTGTEHEVNVEKYLR